MADACRARFSQAAALALLLSVLPSCAAPTLRRDWSTYTGPGAAHFQQPEYVLPIPDDPLEPVNRLFYGLNNLVLLELVEPVSRFWRLIVPQPVRTHLVLATRNIEFPIRGVNHLLQGEFKQAGDESRRFLINTTVGILGLFDRAREWDIPSSTTDTGLTLARWGWEDHTYVHLPILGPGTTRDTVGWVGDLFLDPTTYIGFLPLRPVKTFIQASEHLHDYKRFVRTNYDVYEPVRLAWLISRQILDTSFETVPGEGAANETVDAVRLGVRDPWFPGRARTRRVSIPGAGHIDCDVWMQPSPAPLVYIVPGMGAHRRSNQSLALAEIVYDRGLSAVTVSNPMNFDFMQTAATTRVPGYPPDDSADLHRALEAVDRELQRRHPDHITAKALLGTSLGGYYALYLAGTEASRDSGLAFDRYVAVNPPVRLGHGVDQLDALYNTVLHYPEAQRDARVFAVLQKAIHGGLTSADEKPDNVQFSTEEAQFLIGLTYRMVLHDVIWSSQARDDLGVLRTPLESLKRLPATREILDFSFIEYIYAFVLPTLKAQDPNIRNMEDFFKANDLQTLAAPLQANDRVRVFTSENDFLLSADDVAWLRQTLDPQHTVIQPRGGHMGSLHKPEVQQEVLRLLDDLGE